MNKEFWKDIKDYESYYQISNHGRIKSIKRIIYRKDNVEQHVQERILKNVPRKSKKDYFVTLLWNHGIKKQVTIHRLVATYFIPNPKKLPQVNHIDGDRQNNYYKNLEWVSERENSSHYNLMSGKKTSKYLGVNWDKKAKKWKSQIEINHKSIYLGSFDKETQASKAYKTALKKYGFENKYAV